MLRVEPGDRLLEIGCGRGLAVGLVCERLVGGTITAIDHSATAIAAARSRNAAHVAAGRASFETVALADVDLPPAAFDKVFAVNVNLFWVRPAVAEVAVVMRLLRPTGTVHLLFEPPSASQSAGLADMVSSVLAAGGFEVTTAVAKSPASLIGVIGRVG